MKKKLGLIGFPLSHSFSKRYFTEKFVREGIEDWEYELFPIENIEKLPSILGGGQNLVGLNVTIPYKQQVIPFLDMLTEEAAEIGAVNCIKRLKNGRLCGYNTDVTGFERALNAQLNGAKPQNALVLGTGGAAKAVQFVLKKMNINYELVSREGVRTYANTPPSILTDFQLLVNTTPLGMSPNLETFPPFSENFYKNLTKNHFLHDLVYNPEKTKFLELGEQQGANIKNGLEMLIQQAEKGWEIWNEAS